MFRPRKSLVSISIAREALESIFDECDRQSVDETGGRLIGSYQRKGGQYNIEVLGVLEPGPKAQRSPTSFFQDGDYQERIFRSIEESHPNIEHLGNWHTHHVNGYPTLSEGDTATYLKTVNNAKHNTDFFYALLVVARNANGDPRYEIKHYFFQRNDDSVYEIPGAQVRVVDVPILWPENREKGVSPSPRALHPLRPGPPNRERAKDQELFSESYPGLKPMFSNSMGAVYWKGFLELVDGSHADVVAVENVGEGAPTYSITAAGENSLHADVAERNKERRFRSARHAVIHLERALNRAIYRRKEV
jgi:proteasome lid subunit RPN8/RPN11